MIRVEVIRAWPRRHDAVKLELADASSVADALEQSGFALEGIAGFAIFGERVGSEHPLHDGDRLELLRPLQIDPKEARRRRAMKPPGG